MSGTNAPVTYAGWAVPLNCLLDAAHCEDKDFWKACPDDADYQNSHIRGMITGLWAINKLITDGIEPPTFEVLNEFAKRQDFKAEF